MSGAMEFAKNVCMCVLLSLSAVSNFLWPYGP